MGLPAGTIIEHLDVVKDIGLGEIARTADNSVPQQSAERVSGEYLPLYSNLGPGIARGSRDFTFAGIKLQSHLV